jgi:hypothetical protein
MEMCREHLIKLVMENVSNQMIAQDQDVMAAPNPLSPGLGMVVSGVLDVCSIGDMILGEVLAWAAVQNEEAYQRGAADMARHMRERAKVDATAPATSEPGPPPTPPSTATVLDGVFARVEAERDSEGGDHG